MTILSEMLAQEIDPFRDVGDGGLLFREFQTSLFPPPAGPRFRGALSSLP